MPRKSASFDVLGTCFTFDGAIDLIQNRLGHVLSSAPSPVDAKTLVFLWFFAAQRDFTYLSLCGNYTPIATVLKLTFRRACAVVDIDPSSITDDDLEALMDQVRQLAPRPGLKTCFDGLRDAGWDVYAVTNGAKQTSLAYYAQAGIELDSDHLLSCDAIQVAKPDARVYEYANSHLSARGLGKDGDGDRWFVAAHAWDLIAARNAGFKTAYLTFEEHVAAPELFGEFDIVAKDCEELLSKMKAL